MWTVRGESFLFFLRGCCGGRHNLGVEHVTTIPDIPARLVRAPVETATAALGALCPGCRLFGMTKGQFSLVDLMIAILSQTGPADVTLSTWTTGIRDAESADALMDTGIIRSLTLLTDRSFPTRKPQYCARLLEIFGPDAIRCTRTHAKFLVIRNDCWNIVVTSSMNLNRNPRFEQFTLDDSPALCDFLMEHVSEMLEAAPCGFEFTTAQCDAAFVAAMGGGLSDVYALDSLGGSTSASEVI